MCRTRSTRGTHQGKHEAQHDVDDDEADAEDAPLGRQERHRRERRPVDGVNGANERRVLERDGGGALLACCIDGFLTLTAGVGARELEGDVAEDEEAQERRGDLDVVLGVPCASKRERVSRESLRAARKAGGGERADSRGRTLAAGVLQ